MGGRGDFITILLCQSFCHPVATMTMKTFWTAIAIARGKSNPLPIFETF
jgi:hypothetical protein